MISFHLKIKNPPVCTPRIGSDSLAWNLGLVQILESTSKLSETIVGLVQGNRGGPVNIQSLFAHIWPTHEWIWGPWDPQGSQGPLMSGSKIWTWLFMRMDYVTSAHLVEYIYIYIYHSSIPICYIHLCTVDKQAAQYARLDRCYPAWLRLSNVWALLCKRKDFWYFPLVSQCRQSQPQNQLTTFLAEIRLQVYRHLFIARERIPWCGVREPPKPIEFKTLEWYVDGIQRGGDSVVCRDSLPGDLCCWYEYSLGLALPLLQTCKKIHEEATTVLYGENIFHFGIKCRDPSIPAAIPAQKGRIISQCLRLFEFSDEAWTWDLCDAIQHSVLARFLYK